MTLGQELRIFREVAMAHLGLPYIWGGDDSIQGFDCSGLSIECLKAVGRLPVNGDWTARTLMGMFPPCDMAQLGVLAFRPNGGHMEICLNDVLCIGASGGTSATTSRERAIAQNAYIKVRPREERGMTVLRDPFERGA